MADLNQSGKGLLEGIKYTVRKTELSEETVNTSRQFLAVAYESARNAVEFRSDHLIRQAAIVRILRRRLLLRQPSGEIASLLIKELIWARYLKSDAVPITKIAEVENIVDKYRTAFEIVKNNANSPERSGKQTKTEKDLTEWLLDLAGCEVEECLVFNPFPQLLINFTADSLRPRISIEGVEDEKAKDIQVYIAVERVFAKNSEIFITYHLLKGLFPEWFGLKAEQTAETFPKLMEAKRKIDADLRDPIGDQIKKLVSKKVAPFNVIRELVIRNPKEFVEKAENPDELEKKTRDLLGKLYSETSKKARKAMVRSIIYIFLTKMVLGLALEFPYDLLIGRTNYLALGINLVFPPFLMFLLNARIPTPGQENSDLIVEKINEYLFSDTTGPVSVISKKQESRGKAYNLFLGVYTIFFVGIFVLINYVLSLLDFNAVSKIIFVFFVCVVSFFAYRVKKMSKDYVYQDRKEGVLSSLVDFIFLPILRVGQWLSAEVAKLNFLGLVLDFIIEAPLKAFIAVIDEWVRFVRTKKEEIFTE